MAKLPSFQFYPGDWAKDANLRRCSKAEKGMWIDMLCVAFECEERGFFISAGRPWTDDEIAVAAGGDVAENLKLLAALLAKGVAKRDSRGAIYSARMVRDEAARKRLSENGKKGGNPLLVNQVSKRKVNQGSNQSPKQQVKQNGGSSSSSSSSSSTSSSPSSSTSIEDSGSPAALRPRNELWDAIVEVFGFTTPHPDRERARIGKVVSDLKAKGATPEEIRHRHQVARAAWKGGPGFGPEALAKHWDSLGRGGVSGAPSRSELEKTMQQALLDGQEDAP